MRFNKLKSFCARIGDEVKDSKLPESLIVSIMHPNGVVVKRSSIGYMLKRKRVIEKYGIKFLKSLQDLFIYDTRLVDVAKTFGLSISGVRKIFNRLYDPYTYSDLKNDRSMFFEEKVQKALDKS